MNSSKLNSVRVPGWDRALEDVATAHIDIAPEWGKSDCLLTAADAIFAVTGIDPLAKFRGKYKTEKGAARKMLKNGCENVRDVFEKYLDLEPVNRFAARRGDVGVMIINGEYTAGFICGSGFAVKQPHGLTFFPITEIEQAYKVGD
ncbi:hypothetical protein FHS76_000526 [Ochrobactrum daejeonense]|uniref:DUF6950 domain-containing protein n=1 Tax=Brucella daejeonensis TaxID=659015 RepID=A0A7W9AU82_9HYPH|nr:hypothetical protein [Brucella daejeonensis]MBB5700683.1 hypothetical protein [Brucella daejeonensis]NKB79386.1 hypothetical protein [Brucella daejeonensis]